MGKILLKILTLLVLLVLLMVGAVIFLADPNQYKAGIEQAVLDNSGLQLDIAGDLSLSYRPYIGVVLNDVRLRNPTRSQELASSTRISLRVDPQQLLRGRLLVQELSADDFHINWYTEADGSNAWSTGRFTNSDELPINTDEPSTNTLVDEESDFTTNFSLVSIANASIDVQNLQTSTRYSIQKLNVHSRNTNFENRPFSVEASFDLSGFNIPEPLSFNFVSENRFDLDNTSFNISDIQLVLTPLQVTGNIAVTNVNENMSYSGELETNAVSLDELLALLREIDEAAEPLVLPGTNAPQSKQISLQLSFNGDEIQAQIPSLQVRLDDSLIQAEANVRFASAIAPTNVSYRINADTIDLNSFLTASVNIQDPAASVAPESTTGSAQTLQNQQDAPFEIPKSLLSGKNVLGSITIGSLIYQNIQLDNIDLFAVLENGVLDIESQTADLLGGTVQANIRLNSRPPSSELSGRININEVNVTDLVLPPINLASMSGSLKLEADFTSTGNTTTQLQENLRGTTVFDVVNNAINISIIKQVFTSISALSPSGGAIGQWPTVMRFSEFSGYSIFTNGVDTNQQIKMRLDNIDISGTGGFNPNAGTFAYDLEFTVLGEPYLQTIPINPRYHDVSWPVQCNARFDADSNQFCRPDFRQVREIFDRIAQEESTGDL